MSGTGDVSELSQAKDSRVEALVTAASEVLENRGRRTWLVSSHHESDEISCSCGRVSMAADYDAARASLRRHLRREAQKARAVAERPWDDLRAALAALSGGSVGGGRGV